MKKNSNTKKAYTDTLKNIRKKVDFTAVFMDIPRIGALHKETCIHLAKKDSNKKQH